MYICKKNTSGIVPGFAEVDSSGGNHVRVSEGMFISTTPSHDRMGLPAEPVTRPTSITPQDAPLVAQHQKAA